MKGIRTEENFEIRLLVLCGLMFGGAFAFGLRDG